MKIFYGAAIQGATDQEERSAVNLTLIDHIKSLGHDVATEHTAGKTKEERANRLTESIGPLPPEGLERRIYVRDKMIEAIESDIDVAIFEVSAPSLGTGVEIAHAYLRPRIGLATIPVLALYQKEYWPNELSTMIRGISEDKAPHFHLKDYRDLEQAKSFVTDFCIGRALDISPHWL
jgi:hypothetical protein